MGPMTTEGDVVAAFADIDNAWGRYRATLRAYLAEADRGAQAALSRRLGRTREMLRLDAMTDEQRAARKRS